jgi:multidrug efflux pump subunit AcrA (membrane-fusion protein)
MKKNRRRRWWITIAVAVAVLAGAGTGAYLLLRGEGAAAVTYLTSEVTTGTVSESVEADFTLVSSKSDTTLSPGASGVVTALYIAEGDELKSLEKLAVVSGQRIFALVSPTPLYEELSQGDTNPNVRALEVALKAGGYAHGAVDGSFDTTTEQGFIDWQADNGLDETGAIDLTTFVWVPKHSVVTAVNVTKGSNLSGAGGFATVSYPRAIEAQAQIGQADISSLKKGQKATLTVDGHEDDAVTATITSIATEPASSIAAASGAATSTATAQYAVELKIGKLPEWALTGMSGSMTVTIQEHADVLVVPTAAIAGTASSPYVRLMMDGNLVNRSIETGMATSSLTEVTSGLTAGETVVTGQVTAGEADAQSSGSGGITMPGMGGAAGGQPPAGFQPPSGGQAPAQAGGQ